MCKYKSVMCVLGCVLSCTMTTYANDLQVLENQAWQYAKTAILERLSEEDRELSIEEKEIANEIVESYLILQKEHEQSLDWLQTTQTLPMMGSDKDQILAKKLLEIKQSLHEFFLDKNFGMEYRSFLADSGESSDKVGLSDDDIIENQIDDQTGNKYEKADEK